MPSGGTHLGALGLPDVLECLDLPYGLGKVPAYGRSQYFHGLNDTVGIDYEPAPDVDAAGLVVDVVYPAQVSAGIGNHREGDSPVHHLREFFFVPDFVGKGAVHACREDFYTEFL